MLDVELRVFGIQLLSLRIDTESGEGEGADSGQTGGTVVGFTPSPHDQRWERGVEFE